MQEQNQLLYFRKDEKIPEGLVLLAKAEKSVSCPASIIFESKEKLRVKIEKLEGNAVLDFAVNRMYANTQPFGYEAIGIPALFVKKDETKEICEKKKALFLENLYKANLSKRPIEIIEIKNPMPRSVVALAVCVVLVFVAFCVFSV